MKKAKIVVLTGEKKGEIVPVSRKITIGRDKQNSLSIDDLRISRKHALIEKTRKGIFLKDLGSSNGTYVRGQRIKEYMLQHGDIFLIGSQKFRFEGKDANLDKIPGEDISSAPRPIKDVQFLPGSEPPVMESSKAVAVYDSFFQLPGEKATAKQLRQTQERLQAVYAANQIITSEQDLDKLFERVMDQVFNLIPAKNGIILLKNRDSGVLETGFVKSESTEKVVVSSAIVNKAFENGEAVISHNAAADVRFKDRASIQDQNISSAMCVPLSIQNEILGVIYLDTRDMANAFLNSDLELLVALSGPSAIAIKNAQYLQLLDEGYKDTLTALANAIELRDHYTVGHTWRVTNISVAIAREMNWQEEKLKEVRMGGVLHDVGKIAVPDSILIKQGALDADEYEKMKVHPQRGAELLQDSRLLEPLVPYCLYHHERYDGRGYPQGLKGESIPAEGRLIAVADAFDAMTSHRPYRRGLDPEHAIKEIKDCSGSQFDPDYADSLVSCFGQGKIDQLMQDYFKKSEFSLNCPFCSTYIKLDKQKRSGDNINCHVCNKTIVLEIKRKKVSGKLLKPEKF